MGRFRGAVAGVCVLSTLLTGCKTGPFDADENRDVRTLAYTYYGDVKPQQSYRELQMQYQPLRHRYDGKSNAAAIGAGIVVGGAGGLIALGVVGGAMAFNAVARGITEGNRTKTLNTPVASGDAAALQNQLRGGIASSLSGKKYVVRKLAPLKREDIKADEPLKASRVIPDINVKRLLAENASSASGTPTLATFAGADALVVADLLNYGVMKVENAFVEDRFQPYVIVQVQVYRADTSKAVHRSFYMGLPPAPLPIKKDFDKAVADRKALAEQYRIAMDNALEMITTDLSPAW